MIIKEFTYNSSENQMESDGKCYPLPISSLLSEMFPRLEGEVDFGTIFLDTLLIPGKKVKSNVSWDIKLFKQETTSCENSKQLARIILK